MNLSKWPTLVRGPLWSTSFLGSLEIHTLNGSYKQHVREARVIEDGCLQKRGGRSHRHERRAHRTIDLVTTATATNVPVEFG